MELKSKSIAFVGLAPNIKDKGLGKEIDSHDIVIRTNFFPIPKELQNDYGTKCDILSVIKSQDKLQQSAIDAGVKEIIHYSNIEKIQNVNYTLIDEETRKSFSDFIFGVTGKDPKHPTAGIICMLYCMTQSPASFKFFGVTGYQNENGQVAEYTETNHYVINYSGIDVIKKTENNPMRNYSHHNFGVQNDFLRIALKRGIIKMDEYSQIYFQ